MSEKLTAKQVAAQTTMHKPSPEMRKRIDEAIRKAIGTKVAVEAMIGVRHSDGPNGAPYERFYLDNGHTCFVSGWHKKDGLNVTVSDAKADPKSYTIKNYLARQARAEARLAKKEERAEAKLAKTADRATKAIKAVTKAKAEAASRKAVRAVTKSVAAIQAEQKVSYSKAKQIAAELVTA